MDINIAPNENLALSPDSTSIANVVSFIINGLVVIGIIAALAFLIYGGIKWIMSGGDKQGVEAARNHIIAAIIGLVVVVLAWVVMNIVMQIVGLDSLSTGFGFPTLINPNP